MRTTELVDVTSIPHITHREWKVLAATEFDRMIDLLRQLTPAEWKAQTVCDLWNVRAMVAHVVGMADCTASAREFARVARAAKAKGGSWIDAVTAIQVAERVSMTSDEVVDRLTTIAPKAVRSRARVPAPMRALIRLKQDPPFEKERFSLGYIMDTLSTRDPWTHRVDISRATGRPMVLTPEHDGHIVADAVREWAGRHGQSFSLTLTGPAGGSWRSGSDGDHIEIDALDFCFTLSGRVPGEGLLATATPF